MLKPLLYVALWCFGATANGDVTPASIFTQNAVLQRNKPIPIWGTADAGEKISVSFAGKTSTTTADASGKWRVDLAPLPASATPADLIIQGKNTITLGNIVVGEVWLASGQSNMEFTVNGSYDATIDVQASANFPLIRHFKVAHKISEIPVTTVNGAWQVANPVNTGSFSAVAYYFALDLYQMLNVPVGIINSSWGGTLVQPWMDADTLGGNPAFAVNKKRWAQHADAYPERLTKFNADFDAWEVERDAAKASGASFSKPAPKKPARPSESPQQPSVLNNGMIAPLVPYALRGSIWYQGESNASQANEYHALFSAMITGWRTQFGQGDFPFYWVQLANYQSATDTSWAFLREAQTKTLALPATGQAVIIDVGDVADIHPRNKKDVGRRLARLALARDYGFKINDSGPVMKKAERAGSGFKITFAHTAGSLIAPLNTLSGFELAGADKVFKPADAKIDGESVFVTSSDISEPVAVRYAWRNAPVAGLFNKEGLPAVPFRTDTW